MIDFGYESNDFQAITLKTYPTELSLTAWICLMGTIEGAAVALVMERGNPGAWAIGWDMKLLTVTYGVSFRHVYVKHLLGNYTCKLFLIVWNVNTCRVLSAQPFATTSKDWL